MNDSHPTNPHDHFVRRTFDVVDHTRSLLKTYLPASILNNLRLESLEPCRETFLGSNEHEKRLDLLYTAQFHDGTQVLVYMLLEHKSYIDRYIALQLLGYVLKIQEWRKRNGQPPCVVIPIVIYHGDEPWDEPTSLRDKIAASEHLTAFVPDMQVILADLSRLSAQSLPDIPELEARIRTLQLVRRSEPPFESVVAIFRLLRGAPENHSQKDTLDDIILYMCRVFGAQKLKWFEQAIRAGLQIEPESQMPTIYEALIERGVEKGIEQGIEQGIRKGVVIGAIRTLQKVLRQPIASQEELLLLSLEELQLRAQQLQALVDEHPA
jgi:predicted transposase/invertase (TIGR01784 family)